MKYFIRIDKEKCIHCGLCIRDCVASCLAFDESRVPRYICGGAEMCIACQHCLSICPTGAFSFDGLDPADSAPVMTVDSEALLGFMKSRRSIRQYKDADVPPEKMAKIQEMLAYPPTGVNAPSLRFTIIATRRKMDELREGTYACLDRLPDDSPLAFLKEMAAKGRQAGKDIVYRGAPALVIASVDETKAVEICRPVDPVVALSYLELYAQSLGLGTVWDGYAFAVAKQFPEVEAMFQIPEHCRLAFIMALGIPNVRYARTPQLKTKNVTILK